MRGGDWDETQNGAHRVRSLLSISSLFSVIFMCLILPTLKFILGKSAKKIKNELSQDLMVRFCLLWGNKGLTKKLVEKNVDPYSLYVFLLGFYIQQNVNSSPITLTGVIFTVQCSIL